MPKRGPHYKKYCRLYVSSSSSTSSSSSSSSSSTDSDVGDCESGGNVAAVNLHPHGHLPAQRDVVVCGRCFPCEDPAGAALPGGGVPEHHDTAAIGGGQDNQEVAGGGAAARQQDTT